MHTEKSNPNNGFPTWEEINEFLTLEPNEITETALIERIKNNKPNDLAGEGLQKFLTKKEYRLDALRVWIRAFMTKSNLKQTTRTTNFYVRAIAATLILVVAIGLVLRFRNDTTTWKQYYTTDPGIPIEMSGQNSSDITSWTYKYRTGYFESALNELNNLTNNDTIHFYRASCYFELGKTTACLSELSRMQSTLQGRSVLLKAFAIWSEGNDNGAEEIFRELCFSENGIASQQACFIVRNAFGSAP